MSPTTTTTKPPTPTAPTARKRPPYVPANAAKVLAGTLGILPASMLASAVIGRFLPAPPAIAVSFAYVLWLPLWIGAACWIARARSAKRGWAFVAVATLVTALAAFAIPH